VEQGADGSAIPCDLVPVAAADGSPEPKHRRLMALIAPRPDAKGPRRFALVAAREPAAAGGGKAFAFSDVDAKSVKLEWSSAPDVKRPVFVYNHGMMSKAGVPARYDRACYIHPLYGLEGEVLTEDFPKDHLHHRGVFWSWPHILIDGKEYNSWMPTGISSKHERWIVRHEGAAVGVLAAENGWYVGDRRVMREHVWITAYAATEKTRVVDIDLAWTPLGQAITLRGAEGKSYGGLTFRFAPAEGQPDANKRKDTRVVVPSGVTKGDLPDTRLPWADISGHAAGAPARSGCALFVPKDHPDFPPSWLTRHYGPLCIGWPGVKDETFPPGEPFRVRYRLWIHVGDGDPSVLKDAYEAYTRLDELKWEEP
jgi:hypothetical protein